MKKLPIGIQNFAKLRNEDCVYVDKTALIYSLITKGSYYFLARPRRFGKSLLVSTLQEIFSGNKELFEGLAISALPYDWQEHPVITISFTDIPHDSPAELLSGIKKYLQTVAHDNNILLDNSLLPGQMLQEVVKRLSTYNKVVLLIDEYDYPIIKYIHEPVVAHQMREALKSFYLVIKGLDPYLKFVFLTGVSRFSKTSIFSGLNNLNDITIHVDYDTLLGYTQAEIATYFLPYLNVLGEEQKISLEELNIKIKTWYNGYRFSPRNNAILLYNPFSILLLFNQRQFFNHWFETGTPTFLINLLKANDYPIQNLDGIKATAGELGQFEVENIDLKTLMLQAGYLTIKDYNENTGNFILGYPNREIMEALSRLIAQSMTNVAPAYFRDVVYELPQIFEHCDLERLYDVLRQLFAMVPYTIHIGEEKYYQTIFYLIFKMLGADIVVEYPTNIGRIDCVFQTRTACFVIEFKVNKSADDAMAQIENKKYYEQYALQNKKIILVGIDFDTKIKNVSEIKYEVHS